VTEKICEICKANFHLETLMNTHTTEEHDDYINSAVEHIQKKKVLECHCIVCGKKLDEKDEIYNTGIPGGYLCGLEHAHFYWRVAQLIYGHAVHETDVFKHRIFEKLQETSLAMIEEMKGKIKVKEDGL